MAEACAHCGQVGGMQAGLDKSQCLYCGGLTNADGTAARSVTYAVVPVEEQMVGSPEPESQHPDRRRRPGDIDPEAVAAPAPVPEPAPVVEAPAPAPTPAVDTSVPEAVHEMVDLSAVSPEQAAAIEAVLHNPREN